MKTIKFGIIGAGLMGREFASATARWCHLTEIGAKPELVAVCDKNPALYPWYKDNFPTIKQITAEYTELLANPEVEAVYCAVPHNLHEQIYCDIIKAGKHLLGEKPFGIDKKANERVMNIIYELAKKEKVDESMKQNNQLEWVKCMNNIKNRAEEIVLNELIYVDSVK